MKGGILEVVLESAKGIRHTNLVGKPVYYVIIECGTHERKSKTAEGDYHEVSWNEKFTFQFSMSECQKLSHIRLRIMDEAYFANGSGFIGEAMVLLDGVLMEGNEKGCMELAPTPYNVVLDDDSYHGEIKVGLKFTSNTDIGERREFLAKERGPENRIWKKVVDFCKMSWWRLSYFGRRLDRNEYKQI